MPMNLIFTDWLEILDSDKMKYIWTSYILHEISFHVETPLDIWRKHKLFSTSVSVLDRNLIGTSVYFLRYLTQEISFLLSQSAADFPNFF